MRSDCGRICIRLEPKQAVITEYGPYMDAADGDTAVISEQHPYQSNPVYLTALQQYEQAFARYTALVMGSNVYGSLSKCGAISSKSIEANSEGENENGGIEY
jgi:hypothetical protein